MVQRWLTASCSRLCYVLCSTAPEVMDRSHKQILTSDVRYSWCWLVLNCSALLHLILGFCQSLVIGKLWWSCPESCTQNQGRRLGQQWNYHSLQVIPDAAVQTETICRQCHLAGDLSVQPGLGAWPLLNHNLSLRTMHLLLCQLCVLQND